MRRKVVLCVSVIVVILLLVLLYQHSMKFLYGSLPPLEKRFHVLYVNLEADVDRREKYLVMMPQAYPDHLSIERVLGVPDASGRNGCRLAHLRAIARAQDLNQRYVLITEDDIVPSNVGLPLQTCLTNFLAAVEKLDNSQAPVMLLLECGENLETRIRLRECRAGPHFRRITAGGNNAGAYLVRRDFIQALRRTWSFLPWVHIDHSWQHLWPFNKVWMAFPPPLKQRTVWSHNLKGVRQESRAFDVDMYWAKNWWI